MASNKKLDSRKLYQEILAEKGKINLFKEYIGYYRSLLDAKTAEKRLEITQRHERELAAIDFYLKPVDEVYASLEATLIKDKEEELNLAWRKQRETNKRIVAKDNAQQEALDASLSELRTTYDEQLAALKADTHAQIEAERNSQSGVDFLSKRQELVAKQEAELAAFDEKWAAANDSKYNKNEAKYNKKIAALEKKLAVHQEELEALNEIEKANTILQDGEVLRVQNLCMYFGGLHAVENLSFEVKKGEIYGLIGPNGAGKTTVFNCITHFYRPTSGELAFRSKEDDVIDLNRERSHNIVTVGIARTFQNVEVVRECTVLENMLIAGGRQYQSNLVDHFLHDNMLKLEEAVITQRALKVLEFMGLTPYAYNLAMGLPYGILKKIEIARTLMTNPQLIILDEPAAGLNDTETKDLAKLIRRIRDEWNCTILLVEHDMGLVMDICDRICAIAFGKLLAIGTPAEIQANRAVQEAYLGVSDDEGDK